MQERRDSGGVVRLDRAELGAFGWHGPYRTGTPVPPAGIPGPQDAPASARPQFREGSELPSVVIAAHDEEAVLGACLRSLLSEGVERDRIVVVANGCSDRTAEVARDHGVVVVEREEPGKAAALNAGDAVAHGFPGSTWTRTSCRPPVRSRRSSPRSSPACWRPSPAGG
ncbi:glycosyltransferase [Leifsonia sp. P73]|uniref:glycosyltransferase n=1 Tax=Leifsonia sp. P73 TaxID=3423959 RepID=UPI003DA635DB